MLENIGIVDGKQTAVDKHLGRVAQGLDPVHVGQRVELQGRLRKNRMGVQQVVLMRHKQDLCDGRAIEEMGEQGRDLLGKNVLGKLVGRTVHDGRVMR